MNTTLRHIILSASVFLTIISGSAFSQAHEIVFCGERIPVDKNFVADKLMNVIRRQIPNVNLKQLRKNVEANFPIVEYYLRETGLPEDLKYLAIVESGFQNLTSPVGARGFWQFMDYTARDRGLIVSETIDERDNIYKSTYAACKHLASNYLEIRKKIGVSSWVLTAAAYNVGVGRLIKTISKQGTDYFSMNLNPETASYVYKIIAVKELFEYPELYMKDFGYNVFNATRRAPDIRGNGNIDTSAFTSMVIKVKENDGKHPDRVNVTELAKPAPSALEKKPRVDMDANRIKYVAANIQGRYKNFADGSLVGIELLENMEVKGSFNRKGNVLKGKGWIIGDRVFVDLGYGDHAVTLIDVNGEKGIPLSSLKNNEPLLLKIDKSSG